ncbi:MAG: exonuclease domain-containing protein [Ruminococcaceae bacterium]|nr:exonuclease domain-containing protein [Oscillospiraceae bacterium]
MTYIVMDLEWNQPVSKNSYPYLKIGDKMPNEIIQIGAYKVSDEMEITDSFCAYIRPKYYKKLNSFVKRVTNIDKTTIGEGESFISATQRFKNWCGDDFCLFTWGTDDIQVMKQNLDFYDVDKSFITHWYDMQTIFSVSQLGEKQQKSLSFAMEHMQIKKEENRRLHDALDDAYYTAQILTKHDIRACLKEYSGESNFKVLCSELDDTSFGAFYTKNKAMADKNVALMRCPECGECMKKYGAWLSVNGKYVCLATCAKHGDFISRVKINKHLDGKFYVNKITKKASVQIADDLKKRYDCSKRQAKMKRKPKVSVL